MYCFESARCAPIFRCIFATVGFGNDILHSSQSILSRKSSLKEIEKKTLSDAYCPTKTLVLSKNAFIPFWERFQHIQITDYCFSFFIRFFIPSSPHSPYQSIYVAIVFGRMLRSLSRHWISQLTDADLSPLVGFSAVAPMLQCVFCLQKQSKTLQTKIKTIVCNSS